MDDQKMLKNAKVLEEIIAQEAREFPAFAHARRMALMAYVESEAQLGSDVVGVARSILDRLRHHEAHRDTARPTHGETWDKSPVRFEQTAIFVYEQKRADEALAMAWAKEMR